jgi:hypothetical protein
MWRKALCPKVIVELDHGDLTRAYADPETALAISITSFMAIGDQLIRRPLDQHNLNQETPDATDS